MMNIIPCTVQVLTYNNAKTIRRNLDSLRAFGEVIVQDGASTDGTREIALEYPNVRLIDQDPAFLSPDGTIIDFGSMRNISIFSAKYDWIFPEDADEYLSQSVIEEIRAIVLRNVPGVYQAFRRFIVEGEQIMHCSSYPAMQIRLFHRSCTVSGYRKTVHELLTLKPNVEIGILMSELPLPLPTSSQLRSKYRRYLAMERVRHKGISMSNWFYHIFWRNMRNIAYLTVRTAWIWLTPRTGKRMPLVYEFQTIGYSFSLMLVTFPPCNRSAKQ